MYAVTQSHDTTRKFLIIAAAALVLGVASTSAPARPSSDGVRSVTVHFGELDLSRRAGAQVLFARIQRAAYDVCNGYSGSFAEMQITMSPCYSTALAKAVADVNSPQLSAIYRAHFTRVASN